MEDGLEQHMSMLNSDLVIEKTHYRVMDRSLIPENDSSYANDVCIFFYNECTQYIRFLYNPYYISS